MKNNIKTIADIKGIKMSSLASRLNISNSYMSNIASGRNEIQPKLLEKLSSILNCSKDQIMGLEDISESIYSVNIHDFNRNYTKITLDIIDEICDKYGMSFNNEELSTIINDIYKIVTKFLSEDFDRKQMFNIMQENQKKPIIQGVDIVPLVIEKTSQ